jgi:lia operon protein LiaG
VTDRPIEPQEEAMSDTAIARGRRAALAALACLVAVPATASAQQTEAFRLPGESVAIYNLAGKVQVRGGAGSEVAVTVRRGGPDAARLEVQTGRVDTHQEGFGSVTALRVVYPAETIVYGEGRGSSEIRVRDDGTFFGRSDDGKRIRIRDSGSGVKAHADLEITVPAGRAVLVALAVGEVRAENVNGRLYVDVASADVFSKAGKGDFTLDTGSGDIEVEAHDGSLVCDTGSGDVLLSDVRGGELTFDTGSGDVTGRGVSGTRVLADTGSGDVELTELRADGITADTGSGSVTLAFAVAPGDVNVDVGSGDVRLSFPSGYGAEVEVDTGSGDISTDLPIQVTTVSDDALRGTIGDGSGRLRIDTGSGDVRLEMR